MPGQQQGPIVGLDSLAGYLGVTRQQLDAFDDLPCADAMKGRSPLWSVRTIEKWRQQLVGASR
jgi:hypothetical protein